MELRVYKCCDFREEARFNDLQRELEKNKSQKPKKESGAAPNRQKIEDKMRSVS
jgi:hypothetical protein